MIKAWTSGVHLVIRSRMATAASGVRACIMRRFKETLTDSNRAGLGIYPLLVRIASALHDHGERSNRSLTVGWRAVGNMAYPVQDTTRHPPSLPFLMHLVNAITATICIFSLFPCSFSRTW